MAAPLRNVIHLYPFTELQLHFSLQFYMYILYDSISISCDTTWFGGIVVRTWDSQSRVRRFIDSQPLRCQVTTLGKLFTHDVPLSPSCVFATGHRAVMLYSWESNGRPDGK